MHRFLTREAESWVENGLITEAERRGIMDSYLVTGNLFTIMLPLGVAMLGLGLLCFIAANWDSLPAPVKIALIIGSYVAAVGGALVSEQKKGRVLADALLLLSGFILLGGLALMSQIYHLSAGTSAILGIWLVVFAPTFLLVRNISLFALYEIAAIVYMNIEYSQQAGVYARYQPAFEGIFNPMTLVSPGWPTFLLLFLGGAAWLSRRDAGTAPSGKYSTLKKILGGGESRRIFLWNFYLINWFVWICVLNNRHESFLPFVLGILALGCLISLMAWKLEAKDLDMQGLFCISLSGLALTFPLVWNDWRQDMDSSLTESIAASVVFGAYLVFRILRRQRFGGFAVFLFCGLLMRWFADVYHSFASKALFFALGGAILLVAAFAHRYWNKGAREAAAIEGGDADEAG
jgi:uncharacterized membrane protein